MALCIVVSDTVPAPIEGTIANSRGEKQPFDCRLFCKRLPTSRLNALLNPPPPGKDQPPPPDAFAIIQEIATGWDGVTDEQGRPVPFSSEALVQVLEIPGIPGLGWQSYLREVGAREKN